MPDAFAPTIAGLVCERCGASDLPNLRVVPCVPPFDPLRIAQAMKDGADGVFVVGCDRCAPGSEAEWRRFAVFLSLMEFLGCERERVKLEWVVGPADARVRALAAEVLGAVRRLGPRVAVADHAVPAPKAPPAPPMVAEYAPLTAELRELATRLLAEKRVEVVLAWEQTPAGFRPLFARTAEQVGRLVVDGNALLNLVTYLRGLVRKRVAVVVRPADARVLNLLLAEGQVNREDLFLIGIGGDARRGPLPASAYDVVLGPPPETIEAGLAPSPAVAEIDSWPAAKRAGFWNAELDHCVRCHGCRQACPLCYCAGCLAEQLQPACQSIEIDTREKTLFHVMRAMHLAGRCTGCGACADACPAGVPIGLINQKVMAEVARLFGSYDTGLDPAQGSPLGAFRTDEAAEKGRP